MAEQYRYYPIHIALLKLIQKELIGSPDCLNISLAHEYHGASLMRALLGVPTDMGFSVTSKTYAFPTVETLTRYESYQIEMADMNPNLHYVEEITKISFEGEVLYAPEFGLCGLSQDETAIAHMM